MYFQADMFGQDPRKKQIKDQDEVKIGSDQIRIPDLNKLKPSINSTTSRQ